MTIVPSSDLSDRLSVSISLDDADAAPEHLSERAAQFLREVARRAAIPSWDATVVATHAILRGLGEWLEPDLRTEVASHLPDELGTVLAELDVPHPRRDDVVALYRRTWRHEQTDASLHDVALRCAAVLAVLGETLPGPVVQRVTRALPGDIAALVAIPTRS